MTVKHKNTKVPARLSPADLGGKIRDLRRLLGIDQAELARACGLSQGIVSKWERGERNPGPIALSTIAKLAPDAERDWWMGQAGIALSDFRQDIEEAAFDVVPIPLMRDAVAAGTPRQIQEGEIEMRIPMLREWLPRSGKIVALRVSGDSMDPIIQNGHIVLVDTTIREASKLVEKMVAAREGDGVTIKWLRKDGPHYMLVPQHTSPRHPVRVIDPHGDWGIVGKVVRWIGEPPKK